ncbi:MAG: hypothetical protein GSR73_02810 [Desulfurococcales archaeon]|nr:hypothetical protein [Desulfurococcales archaeon]
MNPYPLLILIIPLVLALSTATLYRSIYPYERVKAAVDKMAEYRALRKQAASSKRLMKKLRSIEPEYRRAKRIVTRSIILKMVLLLVAYMLGSLLVLLYIPAIPAPFNLPPLTMEGNGAYYVFSPILYFLVYILVFLVFRDTFL